jgi:hypothetical protein
MTYGRWFRASVKNQAVEQALAPAPATTGGHQAWRLLDAELKLELIDQAMQAANDRIDPFPLAL